MQDGLSIFSDYTKILGFEFSWTKSKRKKSVAVILQSTKQTFCAQSVSIRLYTGGFLFPNFEID